MTNVADALRDAPPVADGAGPPPAAPPPKRARPKLELRKTGVPRAEVLQFSRQLAAFVRAGVPIIDAVDSLVEESGRSRLGEVLRQVGDSLRSGETFSGALAAHPGAFPTFYVSVLRSAELSGRLDVVLDQLAGYIGRDLDARHKVRSALAYPAIVGILSVLTVVLLVTWVLPRFEAFFDSFESELPLPTRALLGVSGFIGQWWWAIALVLAAAGGGIAFLLRGPAGRARRQSMALRLPAVGAITRSLVLERFCRLLASLLRAGVPIPEAMAVASDGADNVIYGRALVVARQEMLRGDGVAAPIARTGLFPPAACRMLRAGEETGTLDDQLDTAATFYGQDAEFRIERATTLFEPAVIVFMGLVVGFVAIALISAMYGIFNQVQT